ncbi:MAG: hypothetical protein K2H29_07930 [Oscillospiraceae bacterium]|nr:hypothetical protein [Oscillospiraceae bacterium]
MKQKQGEIEAKQILQLKGMQFDESYCDDNSSPSMPDLKYQDGRFLEVTHTLHNNNIAKCNINFIHKSISEKIKIMDQVREARDHILELNRQRIKDKPFRDFTPEEKKKLKKYRKIVRNHFGIYEPDLKRYSEFNCDVPVIRCSVDNIIYEIKKDKAKKYPNGDTDLFIFILQGEFECLDDLLKTGTWNRCYNNFMRAIIQSPFKVIYLCVWDFRNQMYNTENPVLIKFETISDQKLIYGAM